jgi:FixJ family two-component response regulator
MELVFVVEGDRSVREALVRLFDSEGLAVRACVRVDEMLSVGAVEVPACAVVDLSRARTWTPGQRRALAGRHPSMPIVAIGVSDDLQTRRIARRIGAQVFFRKPIDGTALVDAVRWALRTEGMSDPWPASKSTGAGDRGRSYGDDASPKPGPH